MAFLRALHRQEDGCVLSLRNFAKESKISFLFLQRIAARLKEAGMVEARKGSGGGYLLKRPGNEIFLKDVIEAIDGPYGVTTCQIPGKRCERAHVCTVKDLMGGVQRDIVNMLSNTSII